MFTEFYYFLRRHGLRPSTQEWMGLLEAVHLGLAHESMAGFYELCRCLLVKKESQFDLFDQCFAAYFRGAEAPTRLKDELSEWLKHAKLPRELSAEERAALQALSLDELRQKFLERMEEQKERHDGGSKWIGTGGSSPFGHSGTHPTGIRVGGDSRSKSAMQVAEERRFRGLRSDVTLDTRQLTLALKSLRQLTRGEGPQELSLEDSIAATAKNAGDIELVWRPTRKNTVKLLLLMDVGGSMTVHSRLCDQLFSAAHSLNHFKEFRSYAFHNCPYDDLYDSHHPSESIATLDVLKEVDSSWHLLIVGDAMMNPYELTAPGGAINYYQHNAEAGIVWLQRLRERLPRSAWLNPEPPQAWRMTTSVQIVQKIFPTMFQLSIDGLRDAISSLKKV